MENSNLNDSENKINLLISALAKAQMEIKNPKKDRTNPLYKSRYASLDSIYDAIRVEVARAGLSVFFTTDKVENGWVLKALLCHEKGGRMEFTYPLYVDKVTSQGFASALTYGRRYALSCIFSLASDDDDDGNAVEEQNLNNQGILSPAQLNEIEKLLGVNRELRKRFLEVHGVSSIKDLRGNFDVIKKNLIAAKGVSNEES